MTKRDYDKMSEEEKKNYNDGKGYIYMIKNKINGHMYIGLTSLTPSLRFESHINESKKEDSKHKHLYEAFEKHGIENFELTTLGCFNVFDLSQKEKEFIKFYNTYENKEHYNETPGGESQYTKYDEKNIVETYKKLGTIAAVEKELEISDKIIRKVLKRNRIKIRSAGQYQKDNAFTIKIYTLENKFIKSINSSYEAAEWLQENSIKEIKAKNINNLARGLYYSTQKDKPFYGFYFKSEDCPKINTKEQKETQDIFIYKNKVLINTFNSITSLANYLIKNKIVSYNESTVRRHITNALKTDLNLYEFNIKSKYYEEKYKEEIKKYKTNEINKIKNQEIKNIKIRKKKEPKTNTYKEPKNKCPSCGNLKNKRSKLCINCIKEKRRENIPAKEILKKLIRTEAFIKIGQKYNVDGNTIKKWCKYHNLPSHKEFINSISNEDWENENWNIEEDNNKKKKVFNPSYEQLKKDTYELSKKELSKKYNTDISVIKKKLIEYNIPHDSQLIIKFSVEEWNQEKWNDSDFTKYIKTERIKYDYPERTVLKKLIRKHNFIEIGNMYNLDESIIRRLLKQFKLPYHRSEINEYSDEEWDKL